MKVRSFKGMTIVENIIAFTLIITALTIAGTSFYMAGGYVNKGLLYAKAADQVQEIMESGVHEALAAAFKQDTTTKIDGPAVKNQLSDLGYVYDTASQYYYDPATWVIIRPASSNDSTSTSWNNRGCITTNEAIYNYPTETTAAKLDYKFQKINGIYVYVCVPVDINEVEEIYKSSGATAAIQRAEYIPLLYFVNNWGY